MNFLESLRMQNIFGLPPGGMVGNDLPSQGGITGRMPAPPPMGTSMKPSPYEGLFGEGMDMSVSPGTGFEMEPEAPDMGTDIMTRMNSMYTPETAASDRYNELIAGMPQRNNPGALRRIASVLAGTVGGPQAFDMSMYGNFNNKMKDWKEQIDPAYKAATLERQSNVNERTLAYQSVSAQLREEALRHKEAMDTRKADIAQQRANVYEFKARNPQLKLVMTKGGNVMAMDPNTGTMHDTGVPTGSLTDADRLALAQENTLEAIGARGNEARETAETRGEIESGLIGERGDEARRTRATPSGGTGKDELPTQTRVRQFNAARELLNSRPEFKEYIVLGNPGSNDFEITPPGTNFFGSPTGPTQEQYNEIQNFIYGGARPVAAPPPNTSVTPPKSTPPARGGGAGPVGRPQTDNSLTPSNQKRKRAEEILRQNKKPLTEANIKYVMGQLKD